MAKIKRAFLTLLATSILCSSIAFGVDKRRDIEPGGDGTEPMRYKLKLPKITRIKLIENPHDATFDADPRNPQKCSSIFVLKEKDVRMFLTRTDEVTEAAYKEALPLSPCRVSGTLEFSDGKKAEWEIRSFQTGTIQIGKDGKTIFLYCPKCNWRPFNG
jgi:hypothetical protein